MSTTILPPTPAYPTFSTNTKHVRRAITNANARYITSRDYDDIGDNEDYETDPD